MLQWFSFRGRANRLGYVLGMVAPTVLAVFAVAVITIVGGVLERLAGMRLPAFASTAIAVLAVVIMLWTSLAATVRRMRDLGWPIWLGVGILVLLSVGGSFKAGALIRHYQVAGGLMWGAIALATVLFWLLLFLWPGRPKDSEALADVFGPVDAEAGRQAQFG